MSNKKEIAKIAREVKKIKAAVKDWDYAGEKIGVSPELDTPEVQKGFKGLKKYLESFLKKNNIDEDWDVSFIKDNDGGNFIEAVHMGYNKEAGDNPDVFFYIHSLFGMDDVDGAAQVLTNELNYNPEGPRFKGDLRKDVSGSFSFFRKWIDTEFLETFKRVL